MTIIPLAKMASRAMLFGMSEVRALPLYKHLDHWCFDDPERGIEREPFVEGMTELVDAVLEEKPAKIENPVLVFSTKFNPGCRLRLDWEKVDYRDDGEWNYYHCAQLDRGGWLCPCLLQYFDIAPGTIYFDLYGAAHAGGDFVNFTKSLEASAP